MGGQFASDTYDCTYSAPVPQVVSPAPSSDSCKSRAPIVTETQDVVIKVADEGGGIRRSYMNRIWSYLFTTADPAVQEGFVNLGEVESDHAKESPLAGLGYGLPISRSYARYFGGDLSIVSMEGYGTDAFVHLSRLGHHSEPLP